ncbi:hypothetical protein INT47_002789 [Mucor saturninus]|uniref:Uncharacterized protein n=1 Tax=Mucor saturninus TaxID=64648 RepID=A0A8H7QZI8_9FUNG|nr:hypothetical protein INT47_002789 [Mucor saturninus]
MKKANFQPKDARAMSVYREDDLDMDDFLQVSKGKQTATQALVEFLKTSPEEFQRGVPTERSSHNIFSRIRKPKRPSQPPPVPTPSVSTRSIPSSTISLPVTSSSSTLTNPTSYHGSEGQRRKNYVVDLISVSKSAGNSRSPSFETSFVSRTTKGEPILPNKKRESSLYSGSLHHSVSIKSQLSNAAGTRKVLKNPEPSLKSDEMDTIQAALLQRLERMKVSQIEIPSDQIAAGLATEHVRALGITHALDNEHVRDHTKRKVRHMQVQTEEPNTHITQPPIVKAEASSAAPVTSIQAQSQAEIQDNDFEQRAKRAEAALENALDHFEVISGLAYKKLREVWEEKMRWENACMDLRDRLVSMEQQQKKYPFQPSQNDYFAEENEDELGLSEFPCSEPH